MTYLLTHFWAWGVSAFAVGVATALSIARRSERGPVAGWLVWFALAFAAGAPVAMLGLLPGRSGFWLETALLLFPAFLLGAAVGAVIGRHSLRDNEGWALGLIPLALIWIAAGFLAGRSMEQDLRRKAASAIEKIGGDPAYLDVAGRDVLLPRNAPNRAVAAEEIAHIPGVRGIADVDALTGAAAKNYENAAIARRAAREGEQSPTEPAPAPAPNGVAGPAQNGQPRSSNGGSAVAPKLTLEPKEQGRGGVKPAPSTPSAAAPELARPSISAQPSEPAGAVEAGKKYEAGRKAETGKPSAPVEPSEFAKPSEVANPSEAAKPSDGAKPSDLAKAPNLPKPAAGEEPSAAVPASGELDLPTCQKALSAALASEPVRFAKHGAGVRRGATGALDKAVGLLQRCPQTEVDVRVRAEGGDRAAREKARDRAARVVDYLSRMGVERGRLSVAGESGKPVAKGAPEGESGSGVDFLLSPRR
jgi:outer membrane protein OmpA-like peptidoglycan-associated protein